MGDKFRIADHTHYNRVYRVSAHLIFFIEMVILPWKVKGEEVNQLVHAYSRPRRWLNLFISSIFNF